MNSFRKTTIHNELPTFRHHNLYLKEIKKPYYHSFQAYKFLPYNVLNV